MKLPFSFNLSKKEVKNYFLALLLQDEKIGAVVFEETNHNMHVVGRAEEHFPTSLNEVTFEELLETADKAIATAEESLPENIQTEKTVFGVKQEWVIEGRIKKDYLATLKKMCDELSLQPIGFLVFTEAIIHLLQEEEGAPVSAVLVEIGKKLITIYLVRAGRIIDRKQVAFATPVVEAVDTALKQFADIEILPSRIILFDQENNESLAQNFIKHTWSKTLPFLHVPQVTILPAGFETKGVLMGSASQMGFSVSNADTYIPLTKKQQASKPEEKIDVKKYEEKPIQFIKEESPTEIEEELETQPVEENDFEKQPSEKTDAVISEDASSDFFGFVKDKDIVKTPLPKKVKKNIPAENFETTNQIDETFAEIPEEVKEKITLEGSTKGGLPVNGMLLFAGIREKLPNIFAATGKIFKKPHAKKLETKAMHKQDEEPPHMNKKIFIYLAGAFLVIILGILGYIFGISANVTIAVTPKILSDQQTITFSADGKNDFGNNIIGGQLVSVDEKGTLSQATTGTKAVGTPAKGTVTIFNLDTNAASLSANTKLTSSNGLVFTLDQDVNVPPSNGDPTDPQPGKATMTVTSSDIGTNYNLPSGTKFTFSSSNLIAAKNDNAFSGGTKQNINVVSSDDVTNIITALTSNLEAKAKTDLQTKIDGTKLLVPFFTKEEVTDKSLSNKVGDQAKNLSIDATISFESISYNRADLTAYAKQHFQDQLQNAGTLSDNSLQTDISDIKQNKDNSITGTLKLKASLFPTIDVTSLAQKIAGKSFLQATNQLQSINQVANVTISFIPNLPIFPKILPRLPQHIHMHVLSNE